MADILTQAEKDALLSATESDDDGAVAAAEPSPIVTSYDFKHPARVNKDQLRTLENLHDNFARLLSSTFSGAMRAVVDVDTLWRNRATEEDFHWKGRACKGYTRVGSGWKLIMHTGLLRYEGLRTDTP